jgi:acyl-CoA synthetase (AMP-forming)/AMP-acid ligase II
MKLSDIVKNGASRFPNDPCTAVGDRILTYEAAWNVLLQHKSWLESVVGEEAKEDVVVAYLSGNSVDMLLSMLVACSSLDNVTVALLNTRWTPSEMAGALETRNATAKTFILYGPSFEESALAACNLLSHPAQAIVIPALAETYMTSLSETPTDLIANHMKVDEEIDAAIQRLADSRDGNGDAVILFTSGTTSGSKGVRISHKSLGIQALAKLRQPCSYDRKTRMFASTVPLFHVGGLCSTLSVLVAGGTWILPDGGSSSFDPETAIKSVSSPILAANTLVVVPTMLHSILQRVPDTDVYDSVRLLLVGGQSASPETLRHAHCVFPNARIVQTFACTEAASSLTFLQVNPNELESLTLSIPQGGATGDCVGVPPKHVDLVLVDNDCKHAEIQDPFRVGVFATRGPHVMNGYWKRSARNETSSIATYSWYLTNDLGFRDERGRFYFCGRTKDIIRTGGETVIALEVERALLSHPGIEECAVFGLPDNRFGEAVCAAFVCKESQHLSLRDIRSFCSNQGLASYKKPRRVFVVSELPRNSSGKVLKHNLVERYKIQQPLVSKL